MASNRSKNIFLTTYRDDFRDSDNYHRILFNGGRPLQARELTQLQTIIQREVERFGRNIFKDGAAVDPVSNVFVSFVDYVKLDTTTNTLPTDPNDLVGVQFTGNSSSVVATVREVIPAEGSDPATLLVDYIDTSSGSSGSAPVTFTADETISGSGYTLTVASSATTPFGKTTKGHTGEGVFFVQGHFVYVEAQETIVSKYNDTPSTDLGFLVTENVVTENDDNDLYDNQGAVPNLSAPGAHRYQINLTLTTRDNVDSDQNFVYSAKIVDGVVVEVNNGRGDYNKILDVMAQRTFEESGNYTVKPFIANFEEGDSDGALELIVDPGIAYVNGYRVQPLAERIEVPKPTDTITFEEQVTSVTYGNWIQTKADFKGHFATNNQGLIDLKNDSDFGGAIIGTARVRAVCPCGTGTYRHYLYDINMNSGENFRDVVSFGEDSSNYANVLDTTAVLQDPKNNNVFFPLPYDRPSADASLQLDMIVHYRFDAVVNGSGEATITTSDGFSVGGNFTNSTEWIVTVDSSGPVPFTVALSTPPTSATVTVDTSYAGGAMSVHSLIQRQNVLSRTKTLTNNTVDALLESDGTGTKFLNLGKPDIYRVNSAVDSDGTSVIQNYTVDNGQRDNIYKLGRLVLNNSATAPTNRISVDYDYFEHGTSGGYFSVNSYTLDSNFSYADIPSHRLATGEVVELRNVLDFRPVVNDSDELDISTGAIINDLPKNTTLIEGDMSFYLPRRDRLVIQQTGEVEYIQGASSYNPEYPSVPSTAMNLYDIELNANALSPSDTQLNFVENKRYTMRDIGRLEEKIEENRELITLSLLELETSTLEVLDENGNNRTKSGFFVDNFRDHRSQDQTSNEFIASNDLEQGELRPAFKEKHITVSVDSDNSTNVVRRKNAVMLNYSDELYINQPQASGVVNVNPFNVVNNVGYIELTPDKDDWIEETIETNVIQRAAAFINGTTQAVGRGVGTGTAFSGLWVARSDRIISALQRIDPNWQQWDWGWWGRTNKVNSRGIIGANANRFATEFFDLNDVDYTGQHILNDQGATVVNRSWLIGELSRMGVAVEGDRERTKQQVTIPFIRSREVAFVARNLKPLTRHFAFFDNLDMSSWVRGLSESQYNTLVQNIRANPEYRVISGENRGEHPDGSNTITTDASGTIYGSFFIPSNSDLRINTGTKRFALYDIDTPIASAASSSAFAEYTASGLEERITESINETVQLVRYDPIAQTVYNDKGHSVFVTKVGVYLGTKSGSRDLTCEIRPVVNGYPSGTERLKHAIATLSPSQVTTSTDATARTDFVFERPIELKAETEYAIVLLSQSDEYNAWVATMGEFKVGSTTEKITSQPSMGSLFKSQNGATWEPSQNQDLKFQLYVADFSTSTLSGEAAFNVPDVPKKRLPTNPFLTTAGSAEIRVAHPLHGMTAGDDVEISLWDSAQSDSAGVGGIADTFIRGTRTIKAYDASGYTFDADSVASFSTIGGSYFWEATENAQIDVLYTGFDIARPQETSTSSRIKLTSGKSYAGNETAYVFDTSYTDLASNQNNYFDQRKMIANSLLRTNNMAGGETVDLRIAMETANKYVSPVIDYMNTSLHCIANIIDDQDSAGLGGNQPLEFASETNPDGGSSIAKYVSKTVTLASESVGLKVLVAANRPSNCNFDVYYKTVQVDGNIEDVNWVLASVDDLLPSDDNPDVFREYKYTIGGQTGTLDPFVQFKVKVVMRTTDNTQVPRFRDLRVIALAV